MASAVLLPSFTLFPLPFWIPPMATGLPDGGSWLVTELLPGFGQLLMRSKVWWFLDEELNGRSRNASRGSIEFSVHELC